MLLQMRQLNFVADFAAHASIRHGQAANLVAMLVVLSVKGGVAVVKIKIIIRVLILVRGSFTVRLYELLLKQAQPGSHTREHTGLLHQSSEPPLVRQRLVNGVLLVVATGLGGHRRVFVDHIIALILL